MREGVAATMQAATFAIGDARLGSRGGSRGGGGGGGGDEALERERARCRELQGQVDKWRAEAMARRDEIEAKPVAQVWRRSAT